MFVILFYDVNEKRVAKMLKTCRKYLSWVQNSVLEGEITESAVFKLTDEIKKIIDEHDSVVIYKLQSMRYTERVVIGQDKKENPTFL